MRSSLLEPDTPADPVVYKVGLILLLLSCCFFAWYNSNAAYSSDEVWSVKAASQDYSGLMSTLKADVHPPLYFQTLHAWIRLCGTGERAVRSLSGLFYVLGVMALFGLARELYDSKIALVCAALYASSPLAILSAQFARMYSLLSLLSILSTWLYLQLTITRRHSRSHFVLYVVINVLGTFTHIAFFFVLFGQIAVYLLFKWRVQRQFVVAILLSVAPYMILWGPILLRQIRNSTEGLAWVKKPGLSMIVDIVLLYGGVFWLILPVLLFLFWRRRFKFWSNIENIKLPAWLCAFTLVTPLLISVVKPVFNSRLAIIGLHIFALMISSLVGRFAGFVLPLVLVVLTGCFLTVVRPSSQGCDNRALARYLTTHASDNDIVIFTSLTRMPVDHYLRQSVTARKLIETSFPAEIDSHPGYEGSITGEARRAVLDLEAKDLVDRIGAMQTSNKNLRVFFFHGMHPDVDSLLEKRLRERFELVPDQQVQCTEGSPYLKTISVYRPHSAVTLVWLPYFKL